MIEIPFPRNDYVSSFPADKNNSITHLVEFVTVIVKLVLVKITISLNLKNDSLFRLKPGWFTS